MVTAQPCCLPRSSLPLRPQPSRSSRGGGLQGRGGSTALWARPELQGCWLVPASGAGPAPVARPFLETMGCRERTMRRAFSWI